MARAARPDQTGLSNLDTSATPARFAEPACTSGGERAPTAIGRLRAWPLPKVATRVAAPVSARVVAIDIVVKHR